MKKFIIILVILLIFVSFMGVFTSCSKMMGDKEVAVQIKETMTAHKVDGDQTVVVAFVQFGFNINKIYVELPEFEGKIPNTIIIKKVSDTTKFIILNEKGKAQTVSNHGYEFYKWGD